MFPNCTLCTHAHMGAAGLVCVCVIHECRSAVVCYDTFLYIKRVCVCVCACACAWRMPHLLVFFRSVLCVPRNGMLIDNLA